MSEEEKKAIENVKSMFEDITIEELIKDKNLNITIYSLGILDILRVIAIIEKNKKEIEELKEKNITLEGNKIGQQLAINELQHSIEEQARNSVSKDKIRKLIKDINEETQYLGKDRGETKQHYAVGKILELLGE